MDYSLWTYKMRPFSKLELIFLTLGALSCREAVNDRSKNRPSSELEETEGYLDSIEQDVIVSEETEISIGSSTIKIRKDSASKNYRVRMSRLSSGPTLTETESLVLGDTQSDVVSVEIYDPEMNVVLSSADLSLPYEFKQTFTTSAPTSNIGLMVISDQGTPNEQRTLVPSSNLQMKHSNVLNLSDSNQLTATVQLKVTAATLWLVSYTDDALKHLVITAQADSISSAGGGSSTTVVIAPTSAVTGATLKINSDSAYTTTSAVTLSLTATGASEMYITNTGGCVSGGSWEAFTTEKSWTLPSLNSLSRVYAKYRAPGGGASSCVSDSITHDEIPPGPPTAVLDGTTSSSLTASPTFSWTGSPSSDLSHYEVSIGTSLGAQDVKAWTKIGALSSISVSGLSLNDQTTYYPSVRAVDLAGLKSSAAEGDGWTVSTSSLTCPQNFVKVPANNELSIAEFCVMKYEAKILGIDDGETTFNSSLVADSRMSGTPWVDLSQNNAIERCRALGSGYDLLSNLQWQAIARNIEGVGENWSLGSNTGNINDGNMINRGHSDGNPNRPLAASSDDSSCFETGNSTCTIGSHADFSQKRTHLLSNNETIWDLAGNVWEWVRDGGPINSSNAGYATIASTYPNIDFSHWLPAGIYTNKHSHANKGGIGYLAHTDIHGAVPLRGGRHTSGVWSGVFASDVSRSANTRNPSFGGFRCAFKPN